jgi:hypothetical protein
VLLQNALAPGNDRTANLNPLDMADLVKDTKTLFNNQDSIGKQYKEGSMGRAAGLDFVENTMWAAHTRGAGASYLINGGSQSGASLVIDTGTGAIIVRVTCSPLRACSAFTRRPRSRPAFCTSSW